VAVSDRPEGPFADALGRPLIDRFHNGAQPIDPFVFRDDDGQHYLYYGGWRHCNIVRQTPDLLGLAPFPDGVVFKDIRKRMLGRLRFLYGEEKAGQAMPELERILRAHHAHKPDDLYVWTTFSADQIDLYFRNPAVLLRIVDGLLLCARKGADIIRLDAVTYVWADPGTECVHLPETYEIVKLLRDAMSVAAPGVALLTETNVPHEANVSYFGSGSNEELDLRVRRYLASRSIALVLQGVPGIYAHGAIGSSSDHALARMTSVKRDVNRSAIDVGRLAEEVKTPGSRVALLASRWPALSLTRTRERAFHPHGGQRVVRAAPQVFCRPANVA
jgi:hypothetical protein